MRTIAIHRLRGKGGEQVRPGQAFDPKDLSLGKVDLEDLTARGAIRIEEDTNPSNQSGRRKGPAPKTETTDE